jgi:hypothetical protein
MVATTKPITNSIEYLPSVLPETRIQARLRPAVLLRIYVSLMHFSLPFCTFTSTKKVVQT